jgi:hypothetical protein
MKGAKAVSELRITCVYCVAIGIGATGVGCSGQGQQRAEGTTGAEPSSKVTLLRVPDRGIQPQVVVDAKGTVHMVYFKGEAGSGNLFYVRSEDGRKFSDPLRVNSRPNAMAIGNIRGAHLAIGKNGRAHVAWFGSGEAERTGPSKKETPLLYTRLNDAGRAFEPERNVIQFAFGLDGGGSVAADGAGNVYVAWHAAGPNAEGEGGRRVWVARSTDEGKTFAREQAAYAKPTGACGCCGLRTFADSQGTVYVLYRSATEAVHRDSYLLISRDKGASFEGDDVHRWKVAACPMSSFGFCEGGGSVLAAWETDGQVYYTRIDPATGKRSEPVAPPGAAQGRKHPVLAANARGETVMVWTEGMGWNQGGSVAWQVFDKAGKPASESGRAEGVPVWSLVAVFTRSDGGFTVVY